MTRDLPFANKVTGVVFGVAFWRVPKRISIFRSQTGKARWRGMWKKWTFVALIALPVGLMACSKSKGEQKLEKAIEKQGGQAKIDLSKGKMEIKTAEGETTVTGKGGGKLPDGFPKDVLVYKKSTIVVSMKKDEGFLVGFQSDDDAAKVVEAYKKQMPANGWEEKMAVNLPQGTMLQYEKNKRTCAVSITKADEKTGIQVVVSSAE